MQLHPKSSILKQRRVILLTHMDGAQEARNFAKKHSHLFFCILFKPCKPSTLLASVQNIIAATKSVSVQSEQQCLYMYLRVSKPTFLWLSRDQSIQDELEIEDAHKKENEILSKRSVL